MVTSFCFVFFFVFFVCVWWDQLAFKFLPSCFYKKKKKKSFSLLNSLCESFFLFFLTNCLLSLKFNALLVNLSSFFFSFFFFRGSSFRNLTTILFIVLPKIFHQLNCHAVWRLNYESTIYIYIGKNHILVLTFSGYSHFSPYILVLPLLVPILKNAYRFGPCRYIRNGESWRGKRQK